MSEENVKPANYVVPKLLKRNKDKGLILSFKNIALKFNEIRISQTMQEGMKMSLCPPKNACHLTSIYHRCKMSEFALIVFLLIVD